ncbi:erythromycin esterase family protein [Stackebrandtia nassauensis]|uniref:Erythromycin esterase n=1 Tax=Stackebrandtia nassauensis (strain DSM 44728 / CIP 108903 / NRRL B-16338 / NBRC 102104 / LLR-40K-21) TaxID=446470 RepID=D3Q2P9_STANL|nr:erythromycin esterase family protein [Stackebrandtia nassauensis]ADD45800.1 Erythromycin esterase [Stackebrandtia nassauensis DSM 44728]
MTKQIQEFINPSTELLGLGEASHAVPAFGRIRNELFAQLVDNGFRSFALESDRVAGQLVNDYVLGREGTLDDAMSRGFSHGFGTQPANRDLVAWMREYNDGRPSEEQLTFHGFDVPFETVNVPSPRTHLEHARDFLGLDVDIAALAGADERWDSTEAVMVASKSPGLSVEAQQLRVIAEDMLTTLYTQAPSLIAATSRDRWHRVRIHVTAALQLLQYHRLAADPIEDNPRWNRMCATRDAFMAQNLLDIRQAEGDRGPTLVYASNLHLKRGLSTMDMGPMTMEWFGAGAIMAPLLGERYTVIASSLGRSDGIELAEPEAATYEAQLQNRVPDWDLVPAAVVTAANVRTDPTPRQGYFPLDEPTIDGVDAIWHVNDGGETRWQWPS